MTRNTRYRFFLLTKQTPTIRCRFQYLVQSIEPLASKPVVVQNQIPTFQEIILVETIKGMFNHIICLVFVTLLSNLSTYADSDYIPRPERSGQGTYSQRFLLPTAKTITISKSTSQWQLIISELILCRKCGADIADTNYIISKPSPGATTTENRKLFGKQNLTVQTLINPFGVQFEIVTLEKANCEDVGHVSKSECTFCVFSNLKPICRYYIITYIWDNFRIKVQTLGSLDTHGASVHANTVDNILGGHLKDQLMQTKTCQVIRFIHLMD